MEVRALVAVLPAKFENDIEGKKAAWRKSVIETLKVGSEVNRQLERFSPAPSRRTPGSLAGWLADVVCLVGGWWPARTCWPGRRRASSGPITSVLRATVMRPDPSTRTPRRWWWSVSSTPVGGCMQRNRHDNDKPTPFWLQAHSRTNHATSQVRSHLAI